MTRLKRNIALLQGPASPIWRELADHFEDRGATVFKVNISLGDIFYWFGRRSVFFRGTIETWQEFLRGFVQENQVTDILYYGDSLPYHQTALKIAAESGIDVWNIENGYLRPDWITLETEGVNASQKLMQHLHSNTFTQTVGPDSDMPDLVVKYGHSFGNLAWHEATFTIANFAGNLLRITKYEDGRYYHLLGELLPWLFRPLSNAKVQRRAAAFDPARTTSRFFLVALQLQNDFQVQNHSPFEHISQMLDKTITSFARHAPTGAQLVIKLHPHDNGYERWDRVAEKLASRNGIPDRVTALLGGNLERMLDHTLGLVTINSTAGLQSLRHNVPTIALGKAVYDLPGLTYQGGLDRFWTTPEKPNAALLKRFISILVSQLQVRGDFYDPAGRAAAVEKIVDRVLDKDKTIDKSAAVLGDFV